jgi:hypothetical protein
VGDEIRGFEGKEGKEVPFPLLKVFVWPHGVNTRVIPFLEIVRKTFTKYLNGENMQQERGICCK